MVSRPSASPTFTPDMTPSPFLIMNGRFVTLDSLPVRGAGPLADYHPPGQPDGNRDHALGH